MAEQKSNIFRQRSLDRISSPEQLTDYLRVTNPGVWVLLAAVIMLLGGLFAWSMVGSLETLTDGVALVENGQAQIMVTDSGKGEITSDMTVRIDSDEYEIATVEKDDFGRTVALAPVNEADGKYDVKIVIESIHPIKFLFS
ncbi:hypothetical protein SAMN02910447_00284 [Ruminococcus sp. YE71]|uniref:hypothetical protein n=1 Tax=unclassified Ruminococcus TaxID=2608920 RepID=UPI0008859DAB|nr:MULTISPECIES: hypothetical protein [unclassified Ruminococcus]SDA09356.1 hypothetical protein SAMN02910446_00065 [Ruminococcus sp. YE78]SFW12493.1 hypothetical protein SAMN02910447_00284 [Ruminococcus sp. YE71]